MIQNKHILIKNIYYMLSYAFQTLQQSAFEEIAVEEFDNVQNLFSAILSKGIAQQLKQGLYKEYLNRQDDLTSMKGKLDMVGTIRHKIAHRQILSCEYDELSENNLFNQILKTTISLLLKSPEVDSRYKDVLKKELLFFENIDTIDPVEISWCSIRFHRNNRTYQMLISICQLILEGMLMTTDTGDLKLATFIDEQRMCRLYEKFILEYYRKEFSTINADALQIQWALDEGAGTMLPIMQTDITLTYGEAILIIDAKYYSHTTQVQYDVNTIHSNNLYQIFTYVKNKEAEMANMPHKISGMLLYAQTDEAIQPNQSYHMSGNRIDVKTLDLNQDFSQISIQLNDIAHDFLGVERSKEAV